jgi:hypothetical protein
MQDYETAAFKSLEKLKEKHDEELAQLRNQLKTLVYPTLSKELMEIRDKEKRLFTLKEYEKAERLKRKGDIMEKEERRKIEVENEERLKKEEEKLKGK